MRILVLTSIYPSVSDTHAGIFIRTQIEHLVAAGCEANVICPVPYTPVVLSYFDRWKPYAEIPDFEETEFGRVYRPRYFRPPGKWYRGIHCYSMYLGVYKIFRHLINTFKPDVIHAHTATPCGYTAYLLNKNYEIPLVCSLRGSEVNDYTGFGRLSRFLTRKVIREVDQVLTVSRALKKTATNIQLPKTDIKVVYNGCDFEKFTFKPDNRSRIRNELGIPEKECTFIFVGRISKFKGVFELKDAFIQIFKKNPHVHLIYVGDGPERGDIENGRINSKVRKKIHFVGTVDNKNVHRYLSAADVFVLPTYMEGMPNVVLEAMACRLPVIASNVGGIPEAIKDCQNGLLIEPKDVTSLINSMEFMLDHKPEVKKMGQMGYNVAKKKFSWKQNSLQVIKSYKDVVSRRNDLR